MSSRKGTVIFFSALKSLLREHIFNTYLEKHTLPKWTASQWHKAVLYRLAERSTWTIAQLQEMTKKLAVRANWDKPELRAWMAPFESDHKAGGGATAFAAFGVKERTWTVTDIALATTKFVLPPPADEPWTPEEVQRAIHVLSVATIKYGMLKQDSQQVIIAHVCRARGLFTRCGGCGCAMRAHRILYLN
jgi:hypothetical protein